MMERALKERIIGAAVLVVVVVLVVPVFLDGPPREKEIVSTSVPLPGQSEQKVQTVVLDRDRKDPVPAATSNDKVSESPAPQPAAVIEDEKPAVVPVAPEKQAEASTKPPQTVNEEPEPTTTQAVARSATGMWAVQLGSFSNQQNADRLASDLRKQGFAAFLSQASAESGQLHRVRIGPQKDRQSAEAMAERLRKAGHKGQVLPHP